MELAALIISLGVLIVSGAAAVATVVQARIATAAKADSEAARDESRTARDEAVRLSKEANLAFVRQAEAQEKANEIALSLVPEPEVSWMYENVRGVQWVLHNRGTKVARSAVLVDITEPAGFIQPESSTPRDVRPGDYLEFVALATGNGPTPAFRVVWNEDDSTQEFSDDTKMVIRS
ncbi:hypothetical protein ACX3O0_06745 [Homoserinimonas sp. A447]